MWGGSLHRVLMEIFTKELKYLSKDLKEVTD